MTKRHHASIWPRIGIFMLAFIIMLQVCIPSIYAAPTPDTFTKKSGETLPTKSMTAGAYGNGLYIAVGYDGAIIKSTDAEHWENVKTKADSNYSGVIAPASFIFYGVAYGNGVFVAVGSEGVILSSTDGVNWTQRTSGISTQISNVEYFTFNGAGAFYALSKGKYVTSTNGTTWTTVVPTGLPSDKSITQVTVGNNGARLGVSSEEGKIYSTTNGTTWTFVQPVTPASLPANGANFLEWMNDRYFMADISGYIWTSTDLATFTLMGAPSLQVGSNPTGQMRKGFYDGTHYYLFGSEGSKYGSVYTSTDATTWTLQPFEREFVDQNASFINGKYFLFGNEGMSVSDTGSNWSYKWGGNFNEIIYDGTKYIAVGQLGKEGTIWTSNDLSAWTKQSISGQADAFTSVAHGNGKYVAVAGPYHGATKLATSSNGTSWSLQGSLLGNEFFNDVAYGSGIFVATGYTNKAVIETSVDGVTWTEQTLPTNTLNYLASVAYINNQFVALGNANDNFGNVIELAILTSTDGINWVNHSSSYPNSTDFVTNIIFDGSKYILLGYDSLTYEMFTRTSADLVTWSSPGLTGGYSAYGGSTFIGKKGNMLYGLFTDSSYESEDIFYSNDDGATWQATSTLDATKRASALMTVNNEIVISGPNKLVMTSEAVVSSSAITPGTASFDKETSAQVDVAVTMTLNGNTLSSITNGGVTLTAGTDYTVAGNTVTIKKSYLAQQSVGTTNLAFNFSEGAAQTLAVTVSDTTPQNSQLSQTTASFDKETSAQADVAVTLTLNGNTLSSITNGVATLTAGTDYMVVGNVVTINKAYLAQQAVGTTNLAFNFSGGAAQTLAVTVSDTTPQNSQLSQTTASFDKETSAQADVAVTLTLNGNTLSSITNGVVTLTAGTDYTVVGNVVTINKAYLAQQAVGTTNLAFNFSAGAAQTLAVTVSDTTPQNSQLSQTTASFDKETSSQADVAVTLTLNGNTLSSITNGVATLTAGTDYTVVGNVVTIDKAYLAQQAVGTTNLAFNFSAGAAQTLAVTVSDTTPQNSQLSQTTASFDKETSSQADVAVTLTLNGNTLSSITNGVATLTAGTDYTVVGNVVTISKAYLSQQSVGTTNLAFNFSAGAAQTLAVTVSDTTPQNSQLSQTTASFDKETSAQADVAVTLTLNGNTLSSITNGVATLTAGTDYTVVGNVVTINKAYLAQQSVGTTNLAFNFSAGAAQTLAVTVSDTTPQNSQLSQTTASFDKETSAQADVAVTLTLNGNTLSGITNGMSALTPMTDYTLVGNVVTISKTYLAQQAIGTSNLSFNFSGGTAQILAVSISDSTIPAPQDSSLSQTTASFDKEISAQADVSVTLTLNGNTLSGITNGMSALTPMVDYTITGNVVTISKSYLAQQAEGTTNLSFNFNAGAAQTLAVTISDTTPANYEAPVLQAINSDNAKANLQWNPVDGADGYKVYMALQSGAYNTEVTTVGQSVYSYEATGLTNGTTYYFVVKAVFASDLSDASNERSVTPITVAEAPTAVSAAAGNGQATVSFTAPTDNGGSIITGYEVVDAEGHTVATGLVSPITVTDLTNGTSYSFTVKAINGAGSSEASVSSNTVTPSAPTSGGETTQPGSSSSSSSGTSGTGVDIWINGRQERIGSSATSNVNGSTTTTITVDQALLEQKLTAEGQGAIITIPLLGNSSNAVIGELTGQMIKNMEQKQAVLELKTDRATYTVPAQQINIDAISKQLGQAVSLNDITLRLEIGTLTDNMMKIVQGSADKGGFTLAAPSLDFAVSAVYNNQIIPITKFSAYVERTVALPAGIDPNKITTGIVVEPDGTVRHVPTKVLEDKGQYFAKINSLTNSAYSIVWHPLEFKDVANHWAKESVNNMGSRLVINGTGNELFSPNKDITRAEFAAIIVRGLGLKLENSAASFTDVQSADWYGSAVQTASASGLINGFEDGSFRPNDKITREQAMAIIAKAMKITGLKDTLPAVESGELLGRYNDAAKTSAWATAGIADVLQAEIVTGRSDTQLAPKANMTRAEVAAIIERLLKTSGLI
ncbi:X2-like carbohydrate binding domain-containing protein [Paenibacillus sp. FSL H8-0537]|uniref:X2-like carbohydrate binding domain-containing protein n=1 Tax=Paenibacillus sp. FSL H8-0537 TaxID=2921399 RepID=UPI00310160C7